jgi:hypothetical protein
MSATRFLGSTYDMKIYKAGQMFDRENLPEFFNSISRVYLASRTGEIAQIEITLTPSYDDAMFILRSGLLGTGLGKPGQLPKSSKEKQAPKDISSQSTTTTGASDTGLLSDVMAGFAQVEVSLLRPGEGLATRFYRGAITQPSVSIQSAQVTITLKAYGNAIFATSAQYDFDLGKTGTIKELIQACCDLIGYNFSIKKSHKATVDKKLETKVPPKIVRDSPFNMIRWALGQARCSFHDDPLEQNTITIIDMDTSAFKPEEPQITLVQWRQIDPDKNVFPIIDFNLNSNVSLFLTGRSFGNYKLGADEKRKKSSTNNSIESEIDSSDRENKVDTSKTTKRIENTQQRPGISVANYTQSSQEQSNLSDSDSMIGSAQFQKYILTILGIPHIGMLDQVNVLIGDIQELSGVILVTKVEHSLDEGGWITNLEGTVTGDITGDVQKQYKIPLAANANKKSETSATPIGG